MSLMNGGFPQPPRRRPPPSALCGRNGTHAVNRCRSQLPQRRAQAARNSCDMISSRPAPCSPSHFTVVCMGASKAGKTTLLNQFLFEKYVRSYNPTVEEFHWIEYETERANETLTIEIIDTSGSREFLAMREVYYKQGNAFLVVYALNDPSTYAEAIECMEQIQKLNPKNAPILLVANKEDVRLPDSNGNSLTSGPDPQAYALKHRIPVEIITSKDLKQVQKIFWVLMDQLRVSYSPSELQLRKRRQSLPSQRTASDLGIDPIALQHLANEYDRRSKRAGNCAIS
ncbi:hypothetical protein M3Y99_00802300 [Aphelenchoides fujianensis]|nr:hypothetical protein M3Y99_00802300 [Aphelenchoides fujianensis]